MSQVTVIVNMIVIIQKNSINVVVVLEGQPEVLSSSEINKE